MTNIQHNAPSFLAHYADAGLALQTAAIKGACQIGLGNFVTPQADTASARPTTHLFEITLFDVAATGETEQQAVANWFTVAPRLHAPQVAA